MARTPEQKIADLEARLAKAKGEARRIRTRRLIQAGAFLEGFLDDWERLPESKRRDLANGLGVAVKQAHAV